MKQFIGDKQKESNSKNNNDKKDNNSIGKALTSTIDDVTTTTTAISDTISSAFSNYFPTGKTKTSFSLNAKSTAAATTNTDSSSNATSKNEVKKVASSDETMKPSTNKQQQQVVNSSRTNSKQPFHPNNTPHTTPTITTTNIKSISPNKKSPNPSKLTVEQIELIAAPDLNQSKLIEEALKKRKTDKQNNSNRNIGEQQQANSTNNKDSHTTTTNNHNNTGNNNHHKIFDKNSIKLMSERAKKNWHVGMKTLSDAAEATAKETAKVKTVITTKNSFDGGSNVDNNYSDTMLTSIVWKRRDGLGKHSYQPWEKRRLVLSGNSLIYYALENETIESFENDNTGQQHQATSSFQSTLTSSFQSTSNTTQSYASSTPRGTFYLLKDSFSIKASLGHHTHAPTPFVITIVPRFKNVEFNWKICFESHKDMIKWSTALMNIVVQLSIHKFKEKDKEKQQLQEKEWKMMSDDDDSSSSEDEVEDESSFTSPKNSIRSTNSKTLKRSNSTSRNRKQYIFQLLWMISNLVILYSCYCHSYQLFYIVLLLYNGTALALYITFSSKNNILGKLISTSFRRSFYNSKPSSGSKLEQKKLKELDKKKKKKKKKVKNDQSLLTIGASTRKHSNEVDNDENNNNESIEMKNKDDKIEWNTLSSSLFQVRSHDYLISKIKVPSPESLYDLFAVDLFETDRRIANISSLVKLPTDLPKDNPDWNCPEILIFYLSLPTEAPSLGFSSSSDEDAGVGLILICYFRLNDSTKKTLRQIHGDTAATNTAAESTTETSSSDPNQSRINGVKLFSEWVKRSPTDPSFQGRFKLIPISNNLDEVGVPAYMQKYRNKPLLIKRSGTTGIYTSLQKEVLEFEVNFYPFPYLGKQGLSYFRSHYLHKMDLSLAFLIEGRCSEELPEVVIGCVNLPKPNLDLMPNIQG